MSGGVGAEAGLAVLEKMDRRVRRLWWLTVPLGVVAAVDLATGSPIGEWRVDVATLVGLGLQLLGHLQVRHGINRLRAGAARQPTLSTVARTAAWSVLSLGVGGGVGYVLFGWVGAAAIVGSTVLLAGVSFAVGLWVGRRRRHRSTA